MSYAEQRRRQSRETEKRLMQTAWELMSEQSFDAVSVRDICRKAGVTTGAFYHHFPTKEALLDRGYERMDDFIRARVEKSPASRAIDNLRAIFLSYAAYMEQESGELTARFYQNLLSSRSLQAFDQERYIYTAVGRYFSQAVSEGDLTDRYPSAYMADFCVRHFRGTVIDWAFHKYAYPLSRQMESEFRFLCDLFRPARPVPAV